ncbi:MAG: AsnC family transcriptional regulator [Anaerolineae bacterium]|nr:AsnC family transcriptional regulator [Anaerolineae bacterium]NIQ82151.1 AsnC family transcriptional regulator [Anaerolineae bacterium]
MDTRGRRRKRVLRIRTDENLPDYKRAASLDDLDRAILEAHQEDAFCSYRKLAEKQGVTEATIRNRIKRMKASGVMDLVLVINPYKIGYDTITIIGIKLKSDASPEEAVSALLAIPGVSSVVMVTGRFDLLAWYVCRDLEEYRHFVTDELREVPGVEAFESFVGLDLYEPKFQLGVIG